MSGWESIEPGLAMIFRLLWEDWDPIRLKDSTGVSDEYDGYAGEVWRMAKAQASAEGIAAYLNWVVTERMGLSGDQQRESKVAGLALAIAARQSRDVAVQVTEEELQFLRDFASEESLKRELGRAAQHHRVVVLDVESAIHLRKALLCRLNQDGFDENYALTSEGQVMDALSDKLSDVIGTIDSN